MFLSSDQNGIDFARHHLLHEVLAAPPTGSGKLTVDELHKMLGEIAEGSDKLPHLPTSAFTRESFYEGLTQ